MLSYISLMHILVVQGRVLTQNSRVSTAVIMWSCDSNRMIACNTIQTVCDTGFLNYVVKYLSIDDSKISVSYRV